MSQPAISCALAGLPNPYRAFAGAAANDTSVALAAIAIAATRPQSTRCASRDLDIAHLARRIDAPRLDRVVVIDRTRAAHRAKLAVGRLHVTRVVDDARLQQRGTAVPVPVDAKAGKRLRMHRLLELR